MRTKPVGIGVVGAGSIGIRGALAHLCLPDVQDKARLVAVCDPVAGRAQAAADKYGVLRAYDDYTALLNDAEVEAVILCSPIGLHYEQGLAAVRAGKHVHFNKTMTVAASEATEIINEAAKRGLKIVASPGQMLRSSNLRLRKMIQDGVLGRIAWAVTGAAFGSYHEKEGVRTGSDVLTNVNPSWYWRKPGGGPVYDMSVYGMHTLTGLLGAAKQVSAMSGVAIREREWNGQMYPCDADDNTIMTLDFGDNVFAMVHGTFAGTVSVWSQPSIFGQRGAIVGLDFNGSRITYPGSDKDGGNPIVLLPHVAETVHAGMDEAHVFEDTMQLVRWVREEIPSNATAEHARHVVEIIEAGYRAAQTGTTQTLTTTFVAPNGE